MVKKLFNKVFKPNRYNVGRAMVIFYKVINIWKQRAVIGGMTQKVYANIHFI
jgi:hypothetical protein